MQCYMCLVGEKETWKLYLAPTSFVLKHLFEKIREGSKPLENIPDRTQLEKFTLQLRYRVKKVS